jgi:hypothetical protein
MLITVQSVVDVESMVEIFLPDVSSRLTCTTGHVAQLALWASLLSRVGRVQASAGVPTVSSQCLQQGWLKVAICPCECACMAELPLAGPGHDSGGSQSGHSSGGVTACPGHHDAALIMFTLSAVSI